MSDDELGVALLESLQRANPVPLDENGGRRDLPSAHALFAEITAERPRRVRRRTMVIAVALVILLVAALLGAFALVNRNEPTVVGSVACFGTPDYPAHRTYVATSVGDPIAACQVPWHNGMFGTDGSAKGLDACVLPGGAVGVFPGEFGSVCQNLSLPPAHVSASLANLEQFRTETGDAVRDQCVGYDAALAIVEQKLAQFDYLGWAVQPLPGSVPYSDANPCSSIAVDPEHHLVSVEAIEPASSDQPVGNAPK
jgi:hypothetical protein